MYIKEIVVYGRSRSEIEEKYSYELTSIKTVVEELTLDGIANHCPKRGPRGDEGEVTPWKLKSFWGERNEEHGWEECNAYVNANTGRKHYMGMLGVILNRVSCSFSLHRDQLNRWLYTTTPMALKNGLIDLPFLLVPAKEVSEIFERRQMSMREEFERAVAELKELEPLSHSYPFVIIGISHEPCDITWRELESEKGVAENKIIINRSIEFPPEFRQAGLGILNYFGEVVREKYPNEDAKIKIEQHGSMVRMIVEAEDGSREIIEKALEEYELVVTGQVPPEDFFENKAKVLELKSELRIAEARIESQKDLIEYQRNDICELKQLFSQSLTNGYSPNVNLTVSPQISVNTSQTNTISNIIELGGVLDDIQNLMDQETPDLDMSMRLNDLYESIENTDPQADAPSVKDSGALKKIKKFIDEAHETGSKVNNFISSISDGYESLKCFARKYNSIAEWCGAPQVPSSLL